MKPSGVEAEESESVTGMRQNDVPAHMQTSEVGPPVGVWTGSLTEMVGERMSW